MLRALFMLMLVCSFTPVVMGQGANAGMDRQNSTGIFYGKIIDAGTQKALEAVTVQLLQVKQDSGSSKKVETSMAILLTDKKGEFSFENVPLDGTFRLKLSAVGYKAFDTKVSFETPAKPTNPTTAGIKDLGNFKLFQDETQLETVTVNANKPLVQMYLDKKVYNVEKDLASNGGTGLDVMKNIPGILVDIDGNISMRNAAPQVFVDGRPSTLSLDQIPADQIASIEIMTNPSAKYDATGSAGILNIILKKNRRSGYNGNLRASLDSRWKPGVGGDINIKQNKVNFFAAAQFNMRKSLATATTERTDVLQNAVVNSSQSQNPFNKGYFGFGRAGFDFLLTNRTTLTVAANHMQGNFLVRDVLNTMKDTVYSSYSESERAIRDLSARIKFKNSGASLGFKHNFAEAGKEWTADINYNRNHNTNTSDYNSRRFDGYGNEKPATGAERATGGGSTQFYTVQTDFVNPLSATVKFESGLRVAYRDYGSWNDNFRQSPPGSSYLALPATAVEFNFNDVVYAAYGSYSQQIKKFSYQLGLRLERSSYSGALVTKNEQFGNDYPVSLFPSVYLSQALSDKQDLQLNYSRKINRPGFFQILPFVDFSDSLNLAIGNPALKPEFTQLMELTYSHRFSKDHSILATAYGRYSDELITRYQYKGANTDPARTDSVIYNSYANADKSYIYGLELTGKNNLTPWWEISSSVNLFNVVLEAGNIPGASKEALFSWFAKMNHSFKIPAHFTLQVTGDYQAKTILPANSGRANSSGFGGGMYGFSQNLSQGYIKPIYGIDIALRKDFFKNKSLSATLQVNDILRSRSFETHAETAFFAQDNYRLRDPQVLRLSVNWRFGKFDAALIKRKNTRSDSDNGQMQQGVGQ